MCQKEIVRIWLQGDHYPTFTIPKNFAREAGLDKAGPAIIEVTNAGLLLRKLEI